MRINIINHLVCPECRGKFLLSIHKKTKERIINGELECGKCNRKFHIKNGIACFIISCREPTQKTIQKMRKITVEQEIPNKWLKLYSKEEKKALKKEWRWMLSSIKKGKNAIHLDFATGTGRFLRNIVSKTKGEIIALDCDYPTCLELQYFLKRLRKYNRVSIVCADARMIPFKDKTFDSISSWYGIEELRMKSSIKESKRILKNRGFFTTSAIHYPEGSKSFLLAKKYGVRLITKEKLLEWFKETYFNEIEQKIFFQGYGGERDFPIPMFGDCYLMYVIRGRK